MKLSKNLKKIMMSSMALLVLAGIGASANNDNVSAYRVRTHQNIKHHHSKRAVRAYIHKHNIHKYNNKRAKHVENVHHFNIYESRLIKRYNRLVYLNGHYKYNSSNWNNNMSKITKMNKLAYYQGYNEGHSKAYHQGYRDGYNNVSNKDDYAFAKKYRNSKQYKQGFIKAVQYSDLYNPHTYKRALARYDYMRHNSFYSHEVWTAKKNPGHMDFYGIAPFKN